MANCFMAGDHILGDITPNIQCRKDDYDPMVNHLNRPGRISRWRKSGSPPARAMAHLRYLENKQDIVRGQQDGVRVYGLRG